MAESAGAGVRAARRFAREHDSEPTHVFQVSKNCMTLFDGLADVHGLGARERDLLEAAALLHDLGYEVDVVRHHKVSRDMILDSGLEGFTKRELMMVACIARYHRKGSPQENHKVYRDLDERERDRVNRLAALLRVGDGLDRSHTSCTRGIRIERKTRAIRLVVEQREPNPIDIEGAMRKRQLFEEVFDVQLDVAPAATDKTRSRIGT